jgi:hypothetical protein
MGTAYDARSRRRAVVRRYTAAVSAVVIASLLAPAFLVPAASAAEQSGPEVHYADVGFDPDDRPVDETSCCQQDPDIRWTNRKVWIDRRERAWLTITFQAYEIFTGYWSVIARLDSRGGPRADYRMPVRDGGSLVECSITSIRSSVTRQGTARQALSDGRPATCRVPLSFIRRDKRIRWRLVSPPEVPGEGSEPGIYEYAPDSGWYV